MYFSEHLFLVQKNQNIEKGVRVARPVGSLSSWPPPSPPGTQPARFTGLYRLGVYKPTHTCIFFPFFINTDGSTV